MSRSLSAFPILGVALALTAAPAPAQMVEDVFQYGPVRAVTLFKGLEQAWSLAFLPGGDMLITEKPGRLRVVRNGVLQPEPVAGVPKVRFRGQGGLLDVALHPNFAQNQLVYLSFSKGNETDSLGTTAVVRGRLDGNRLADVEEIFEANAWSPGNGHFGSRLAFDREGYLFITVGDRQFPPTGTVAEQEKHPAQDLTKDQGKVHRIHDDGRVPADNPFVNTAGARGTIWSYGHRSPQGLAIDPETGTIFESEHGPQGGDELNLIQKGRNYGWPVIGYGVNYGGAKLHATREREGMEQPLWFFVPSIATSGLLVYRGDRFPAWQGQVFMGGMVANYLARVPVLPPDQTVPAVHISRPGPQVLSGIGEIRDVRQGPDGFIYLIVDNRRGDQTSDVMRVEPVPVPTADR